ncbi:MAG: ABC transporter permease [Devosia sp.]
MREVAAVKLHGVNTYAAGAAGREAQADLLQGLARYRFWLFLAAHDIRQRFRRSVLGPLWLTLSTGILVLAIGVVFSTLFRQDLGSTLPHVATGMILWNVVTTCLLEGLTVFIAAQGYIHNVPLPLSVHLYRMLARNVFILGFNMAIYVAVAVIFRLTPDWAMLAFIPGFSLFMLNCAWLSLLAAIAATRFRDIPPIVNSLVQVVFFVTPVFWSVESMPNHPAFVTYNPFYHMLEIVRAPLLGHMPHLSSWSYCAVMAMVGLTVTYLAYRRFCVRIPFWL